MKMMNLLFSFLALVLLLVSCAGGGPDEPQWQVVIAFSDGMISTEDWAWLWGDVRGACQEVGIIPIYFDVSQAESDQVTIGPKEAPLATLDLVPYVEQYHRGYLFVQEGHPAHYQAYTSSDVLINNASQYFGIPLTNP